MLTNPYHLAQPPYDIRFPDHFFVRSHQIRHPCDTTLLPTLFPKNISNFFPYSPVFTTSIKSALNQRSRPALQDSLATHSPCPAHHPRNHSSPIFPSHQTRPHQNRSPPLTPRTTHPQPTLHVQTCMAALSQSFGHPKTNFLLASHKIISNQPSVRDFFENLFCPLTMIQMDTIRTTPLPCRSPHHTHAKLHPDSPAPEHPRKYGNTGISVFFLVYTQTTYEFMNRSEVPRRNTEIPVFPYFRYFRRSPQKKPRFKA